MVSINSALITPTDKPTPKVLAEAISHNTIEFDIRNSDFAGGAPMNGIDDDAPALRAAAQFFKTIGATYTGGKPVIRLPRGVLRVDSIGPDGESIDVTNCQGVSFIGESRAATHIKSSVNAPVIRGRDVAGSAALNYPKFAGFTIRGPGASNANAHGLDLGAPFNGQIDVRIWGCRDAIRINNSWQTTLQDIRIDGTDANKSYNGLVQTDGSLSVAENAILVLGGQIQGCENDGYRGECVTGSKIFGLEIVGVGNRACYLGDSPGGKDLKWFSWVGGLLDTASKLLVVKKGSSTIAERMHFSGIWSSYAFAGAGNGTNVEFNGLKDCSFQGDMLNACDLMFHAIDCDRVSMKTPIMSGYDRSLIGQRAAIIHNTSNSVFDYGTTRKTASSPVTRTFEETGTSSNNRHYGNIDEFPFLIAANGSTFEGFAKVAGALNRWPGSEAIKTKAELALMTAAQYRGKTAICTDEAGGEVPVWQDQAGVWRRCTDRAIVS